MPLTRFFALALLATAPVLAQYSTPMRNVDDPGRNPVVFTGTIYVMQTTNAYDLTTVNVPAGKRLVIDELTLASTRNNGGQPPLVTMTFSVNAVVATHAFPLSLVWHLPEADTYAAAYQTKIVTDAGVHVAMRVLFEAPVTASLQYTISGHWVSLP